jgi:hypothetical protein
MRYNEFSKLSVSEGYEEPNDNELAKAHAGEVRKPRLTLKMVNKLKKIRAVNDLENSKKESLLHIMYGEPEETNDGSF